MGFLSHYRILQGTQQAVAAVLVGGIAGGAVDLIVQRQALSVALEVVDEDVHDVVQRLGQAELAGVVGRDDSARLTPQRVVGRQRLRVALTVCCSIK